MLSVLAIATVCILQVALTRWKLGDEPLVLRIVVLSCPWCRMELPVVSIEEDGTLLLKARSVSLET